MTIIIARQSPKLGQWFNPINSSTTVIKMEILEQLQAIHQIVKQDPANPDLKSRRQFWRIVSRIKRMESPETAVIAEASKIRNLLYKQRLGRSISLNWLILWFLCGMSAIFYYLWLLLIEQRATGSLMADYDLGALVAGAMFFLYPFGRLIAGSLMGIRFDGISRDIYYLPTLKINYPTYLQAPPPNRLWFFFLAGFWTAFIMICIGITGYLLAGEWTAIAFGLFLAFLEALAAIFGGKWGGELGHFHRELRIVREWKQNLT
jgi:hypothetical protein